MKRTLVIAALALALPMGSLYASGAPKVPQQKLSVEEQAARSFNEGIRQRDKAWKYEKELASETNPAKVAKLEGKIEKAYDKAIRYYEKAIKGDSNLFQAHGSLGYALRKTGRYAEALVAYDRALELAPGYAEAMEYRAEAYLGLGRLDDAKRAYLTLFAGGSDRSAELLVAMRKWVDKNEGSSSVDGGDVTTFSRWVAQREKVAGMQGATASGGSW